MWAVSAEFLDTVRLSHVVTLQADAYRDNRLVLADIPISGGSVGVDDSSMIRRTLSLNVADPALNPGTDPYAVLTPYAAEIAVRRGVRYPNGTTEWVPVGRFRVETAQATATGSLAITGSDRSAYLQDARFTALTKSNTKNTIPAEITRLIRAVLPGVQVIDLTGSTARTPAVVWEDDRIAAITDLATSIGADVYFDPTGQAVIAPTPAISDAPVTTIDAGASGVMIDVTAETTREGTYNGVVVSGEPLDGTPVSVLVTDNNPSSPTMWGGPFGRKPYYYKSPFITTVAQATKAATSLLNKVKGTSRSLTVSLVPNPALEVGDVMLVLLPNGKAERHLIDTIGLPLDAETAMTIETKTPEPEQS